MSSKKIYNTIGLDAQIWTLVEQTAKKRERSRSFVIEKILEKHFEVKSEANHVDES